MHIIGVYVSVIIIFKIIIIINKCYYSAKA